MKEFFKTMKDFAVRRKVVPKALSILLAIGLWLYVGQKKIGAVKLRIPVEYRNLPKTLVIASNQNSFVAVELHGRKEDLNSVTIKNLRAYVNLESPNVGAKESYPIELVKQQLPDNVEVALTQKDMSLVVERKETKTVRVKPVITGSIRSGHIMGVVKVTPDTVVATGPESALRDLSTVPTRKISIENEKGRLVKIVAIDRSAIKKHLEFDKTSVNVVIPIVEASNLVRIERPVELRNKNPHYLYEYENIVSKVMFRPRKPGIEISGKDFRVIVDVASLPIDRMFDEKQEARVTVEFPVVVVTRPGLDIDVISVAPDSLSVTVIKKP